MTRLRLQFLLAAALVVFSLAARAEEDSGMEILSGKAEFSLRDKSLTVKSNAVIKWNGAVLCADTVTVDQETGETLADGNVRIQWNDQVWNGDHVRYNFTTHQMQTAEFRTGKSPFLAGGEGLHGFLTNRLATNQLYFATNGFVTTDDFSTPAYTVRARHVRLIPGKRIEASDAVVYLGDVPVLYLPYYSRNLGERADNFNFSPGYRSAFGAFLLNNYTWFLGNDLDGKLHLDYREKRGLGFGPDFNFHLGRWGDGSLRYYYLQDQSPGTNLAGVNLPHNRERVYFSYLASPWTNFTFKSLARYQSDTDMVKTFFEGEYRDDPQQDTFAEANKFWQNWSLDVFAQPRVNDFYETVARLPDVRLTGFRQQIGESPLYYESQSSVGYYRRLFAETNSIDLGLDYEAARADTYHQLTLPETFFGWLNVTPRLGGRFTYYSKATGAGATTDEIYREVLNTGGEVSFKAWRLWPQAESKLLDLDGVRHIIVPSVNYVYVPRPNHTPDQLPAFDYELPSLRQLPVEFYEYNAIDSIDTENVIRFGLNNKLQTKRDGQVEDFLRWELSTDWRLRPQTNQETFSDLYSDLAFRPRHWITLESQTRYDINAGHWRMLLHTLTFEPNDKWSWTVGHFYLRDDFENTPTALGQGNNLITSSMFYRLNENWGLRATHDFDARDGQMQEQYYTVYRDFRSWTAAITGGVLEDVNGQKDYRVSFSFSLKAMPSNKLGRDTADHLSMLGQ